MKTNFLFSVLFILGTFILFTTCKKKETVPVSAGIKVHRIQTEVSYNSNNQVTEIAYFDYDQSNNLTEINSDDGSSVKYSYEASKVIAKVYNSNNILTEKITYNLNSQGLASSVIDSSSSGISTQTYNYNGSGYVTSSCLTENTFKDSVQLVISGGNIINLTDTVYFGTMVVSTGKIIYEYFTDKTNTIGEQNYGMSFVGKMNQNLVKTEIQTFGVTPTVINYAYETDSQGRVTKKIILNGGNYSSVSYTYEN